MKNKLTAFMQGRYGNDELNICLYILSVVFYLFSAIWGIFSSLGLVCLVFALFRALSKNIYKRREENARIIPYWSFVKAKINDKGKNKIFLCPGCKRTLRIPKGRGRVTVNCPCGRALKRKS